MLKKNFTFLLLLGCAFFLPRIGSAQTYVHFTVNQPAELMADAGPDSMACLDTPVMLGGMAGQGGTSPYTFDWSPTTGLSSSTVANPTVTIPTADTITFTVTVTDANGCTASDDVIFISMVCVGLENAVGIQAFEVWPNPTEGAFQISAQLSQPFSAATLRMVDLQGKLVWEKKHDQPGLRLEESVNLTSLARGTYTLELDADGQRVSRKIILR